MFFSYTTDGEGGRGGVGSANFLDDLGDSRMLRIMINFLTEVRIPISSHWPEIYI